MTRPTLLRALFWTCVLGVLVLALAPRPPLPLTTGWDKGNHCLAFFVMTVLGRGAYPKDWKALAGGLVVYGVVIELLQMLTPNRSAEFVDVIADSVGIVAAFAIMTIVHRGTERYRAKARRDAVSI